MISDLRISTDLVLKRMMPCTMRNCLPEQEMRVTCAQKGQLIGGEGCIGTSTYGNNVVVNVDHLASSVAG